MIKTRIDWCDSSWNPVTGCYHTCKYCYARSTANRFKGCDDAPDGTTEEDVIYLTERPRVTRNNGDKQVAAYPYGFTPTFHEYRLNDPSTKGFGETVFVCSMADLFGDWVPDEWIIKVFEACKQSPSHRYLFLTKNPFRYVQLHDKGLLPELDNFWYGSTMDNPKAEVFKSTKHNTFISIEPILEPFPYPDSPAALTDNWVIFGAETGKRADKVTPERSWLEPYVEFCKEHQIPVFMKESLKDIWGEPLIQEYPWETKK